MMIPIKLHAIASSALIYPWLKIKRMLFIDHLILLSVLDALQDGRGMPSHGKRMKLVGLQHKISILGESWKQYLLLYSLLLLPHVSVQMLSLLLNNAFDVFEICNKILLGINRQRKKVLPGNMTWKITAKFWKFWQGYVLKNKHRVVEKSFEQNYE